MSELEVKCEPTARNVVRYDARAVPKTVEFAVDRHANVAAGERFDLGKGRQISSDGSGIPWNTLPQRQRKSAFDIVKLCV